MSRKREPCSVVDGATLTQEESFMMTERRPTRKQRKTMSSFDPMARENDRLLRIALKRSKLESKGSAPMNETGDSPMTLLEHVPVIHATWEEFEDPVSLWQSLTPLGLQYGAVKLKPPEGWRPPFCLNVDDVEFYVREQKVHRLAYGKAFTFPKDRWTGKQFKKFAKEFEEKRHKAQCETEKSNLTAKNNVKELEKQYWALVDTQVEPVSVYYGADIEVSETGSGFPDPRGLPESSTVDNVLPESVGPMQEASHTVPCFTSGSADEFAYYARHPWNLLNLPKAPGSLLQTFRYVVPGVTCPWMYLGMLFSSFCWHTEDNYFAAANYQHFGDIKVWYVIPPSYAVSMQRFMRNYVCHRRASDVLHSLTVQISPNLLTQNNIKVYRVEQAASEFVLLWPRAFHCGFNTGLNCNEACNVAPPVWLDWGHLAVDAYRNLRPMCIAYEQVIYMAAASYSRLTREDTISKLIESLSQLIVENYRQRTRLMKGGRLEPSRERVGDSGTPSAPVGFTQLPFVLSRKLPAHARRSISTSSQRYRDSVPSNEKYGSVHHGSNLSRSCAQLECFKIAALHPVDEEHSSDEEFARQVDAVARLPFQDCTSCRAACYLGFVACSHSDQYMCLTCAVAFVDGSTKSKWICDEANVCNQRQDGETASTCSTALLIYRFSLPVQLRLLNLLVRRLGELNSTKENSNLVDTKKPTMQQVKTSTMSCNQRQDRRRSRINKRESETFYPDQIPLKREVKPLQEDYNQLQARLCYRGPFFRSDFSGATTRRRRSAGRSALTKEVRDSLPRGQLSARCSRELEVISAPSSQGRSQSLNTLEETSIFTDELTTSSGNEEVSDIEETDWDSEMSSYETSGTKKPSTFDDRDAAMSLLAIRLSSRHLVQALRNDEQDTSSEDECDEEHSRNVLDIIEKTTEVSIKNKADRAITTPSCMLPDSEDSGSPLSHILGERSEKTCSR